MNITEMWYTKDSNAVQSGSHRFESQPENYTPDCKLTPWIRTNSHSASQEIPRLLW